ncbi:uncharacterized protein LOC108109432 [Drosophila eugracilis]|uniref:uncharacterized protein LOC108109432 n=1 Tax=Drosophila eugracilis TaxID=29029 RepID=UPI0007E5E5D5|nr:uncharacterized protein LOC108109432 [Drosophila eugracilis]
MPQLKLNFGSEKMSMMIHTIFRLSLLLIFLGYVAPYQSTNQCQPNWGYCQMHTDCCSRKCMTYSLYCAPNAPHFNPIKLYTVSNSIFEANTKAVKVKDEQDVVVSVKEKVTPTCNQTGGPCSRAEDCCNFRCHTYIHRCVT